MFERPGEKLEGVAIVYMILNCIAAGLMLLVSMFAGDFGVFLTCLISAALVVLSGWLGALAIATLARAAIRAEAAANYAYKALQRLEQMSGSEASGAPSAPKKAPEYKLVNGQYVPVSQPGQAPHLSQNPNDVPAWKRVQQNKDQ